MLFDKIRFSNFTLFLGYNYTYTNKICSSIKEVQFPPILFDKTFSVSGFWWAKLQTTIMVSRGMLGGVTRFYHKCITITKINKC